MFTKAGIVELHATTHERLDLVLRHVATVPDGLYRKPISGFGHPSVWQQLVHILACEEGWVHALKNKPFRAEECPNMPALRAAKDRIREATRTYLGNLTEEQLNTILAERPTDGGGELRDSCFYPIARDNPCISPQRPDRCDAANSRLPGTGHGFAASIDSFRNRSCRAQC